MRLLPSVLLMALTATSADAAMQTHAVDDTNLFLMPGKASCLDIQAIAAKHGFDVVATNKATGRLIASPRKSTHSEFAAILLQCSPANDLESVGYVIEAPVYGEKLQELERRVGKPTSVSNHDSGASAHWITREIELSILSGQQEGKPVVLITLLKK